MDRVMFALLGEMCRSWEMFLSAGASIVLLIRDTRPPVEMRRVIVHFRATGQLRGFVGSVSPFHVTSNVSLLGFSSAFGGTVAFSRVLGVVSPINEGL